jgi:predicted restriction endonuclease
LRGLTGAILRRLRRFGKNILRTPDYRCAVGGRRKKEITASRVDTAIFSGRNGQWPETKMNVVNLCANLGLDSNPGALSSP